MSEPIISVSGLRGIVGETLTGEVAVRYAAAFAAMLRRRARSSSAATAAPRAKCSSEAIQAGLQAAGHDTLDAGIVATPTVGVLVRHCRAAAGIAVTASHNPLPYNGVKLFSAEGRVVPAEMGQQVLTRYRIGRGHSASACLARNAPDGGRLALQPPRSGSGDRGRRADPRLPLPGLCWTPTTGRAARWAEGCWRHWAAA